MKGPDELLAYLRYLRGRVELLENAEQIGVQEVALLQGELRVFRERVLKLSYASESLKEHLSTVRLEIAREHIEGTKEHSFSTWWMHLPLCRLFYASRQQKDREDIEAKLSSLKSNLYALYCLVEVTFKESNYTAEPATPSRSGS